MKKYELLCIIKPNLDMEEVEKVTQSIEESIKSNGGNLLNTDKMGRKKLAYEIQKFRDGFYVVFTFEGEEAKIVHIRKYLKLNEDILRELVTVVEPEKVAAQ